MGYLNGMNDTIIQINANGQNNVTKSEILLFYEDGQKKKKKKTKNVKVDYIKE